MASSQSQSGKRAFLSYVHEDTAHVDKLCDMILKPANVLYWRDRNDLGPGDMWKNKIRDAINSDALVFLACFSSQSVAKAESYQNMEINLAVNAFYTRPPGKRWIIPVRFDNCEIPQWDLGDLRTLRDIHYVDLFGENYTENAIKLIDSIRKAIASPNIELNELDKDSLIQASRFFSKTDDIDEITQRIPNCQTEVWLWGTTLSMHIDYLAPYIVEALAGNRQVKVLLIKPGGDAVTMSGFRAGPKGYSVAKQNKDLRDNLTTLWDIKANSPGLEIKVVDYLAPYTLYAYDPDSVNGHMELRLGSFHGNHKLRPSFELRRDRDGDWFDYFCDQFRSVWRAAHDYEPNRAEPTASA